MSEDSHSDGHMDDDQPTMETARETSAREAQDSEIQIQEFDSKPSSQLGQVVLAIVLIQYLMVLSLDLDGGFFLLCLLLYGFAFLIAKGTGSVVVFLMWCFLIVFLINVLASIAGVWGAPF